MVSFVVKSALWCQFCPHGFNSSSPVNHFINTSPFISLPQLSQNQHLQTAPHECENKHFQTLSFHILVQPPRVSPLAATATKIRFSWRGDGEFMPLSAPASPCSPSVPSDERGFS